MIKVVYEEYVCECSPVSLRVPLHVPFETEEDRKNIFVRYYKAELKNAELKISLLHNLLEKPWYKLLWMKLKGEI